LNEVSYRKQIAHQHLSRLYGMCSGIKILGSWR